MLRGLWYDWYWSLSAKPGAILESAVVDIVIVDLQWLTFRDRQSSLFGSNYKPSISLTINLLIVIKLSLVNKFLTGQQLLLRMRTSS